MSAGEIVTRAVELGAALRVNARELVTRAVELETALPAGRRFA